MKGKSVVIKIFFFMMTPALLVSSCITEKSLIRSTASYVVEITPGTIQTPAGDEGVAKIDTVVIIYIQSKRNDLIWDSAFVNGHGYKLTSQIISSNAYEAGTNAQTGNKEMIVVAEGNVLYQLQFQKTGAQKQQHILNETQLHFRCKNKSFTTIVNKPVFLLQQPSV
jgi:hypothetical protein